MTRKGLARGKLIELDEALPFPEGQPVNVSVEPAGGNSAAGSPAEVLEALRRTPHLDDADVDEFERNVAQGKLPVRRDSVFDPQT